MACFWQVNCTWQMSSYTSTPCNDLCTQPNSSLISKTFHYQSVGPSSQHCWFLSAQQKYCPSQEPPVADCLAREGTWHSAKPTSSGGTWGICSHVSWILFIAVTPGSLFWEDNPTSCKTIICFLTIFCFLSPFSYSSPKGKLPMGLWFPVLSVENIHRQRVLHWLESTGKRVGKRSCYKSSSSLPLKLWVSSYVSRKEESSQVFAYHVEMSIITPMACPEIQVVVQWSLPFICKSNLWPLSVFRPSQHCCSVIYTTIFKTTCLSFSCLG